MQRYLRFKPFLVPSVVKGKGVFLLDENLFQFMVGPVVAAVADALVSDHRTREQIIQHLDGIVPRQQVEEYLEQMGQDGFIYETHGGEPGPADLFWARTGLDPDQVGCALETKSVSLRTFGVSDQPMCEALHELGVRVGPNGDLTIILVDDFLHPALSTINRRALEDQAPWMLVKSSGRSIWIALFVPGRTACWSCLASRLRENQPARTFLEDALGRNIPPAASPSLFPPTFRQTCHRAAVESVRWLATAGGTELEGMLLEINAVTAAPAHHSIARLTHCPACGMPADTSLAPAPYGLRSRKKDSSVRNGSRATTPARAFSLHRHLIDPITGVFGSMKRVRASKGSPMHTYVIQHSIAYRIDSLGKLQSAEEHLSGGKGRNRHEARASALFEAVERRSGRWRAGLFHRMSSYEMLGDEAVHPDVLQLFSERQYDERLEWNARAESRVLRVPEPFNPAETIAWVPAWSVTAGAFRYVPASYAYYDFPHAGTSFFVANSNGCAAGSNVEEAVLQGAYELFERDALSLWWYNMIRRPEVDLRSFEDPYFDRLRAFYVRNGRKMWVLDVTGDLGVPVMVTVSKADSGPPQWVIGFGAHGDARVAVARALTEMNQMMPALTQASLSVRIPGTGEARGGHSWFQTASEEELFYLLPDDRQGVKTAADYVEPSSDDLLADIMELVDRLRKRDMEMLILDQTDPHVGIPVVRVMVPGLYHYWRRLGGERLYQVPFERAWIAQPRTEEAVNFRSIPI